MNNLVIEAILKINPSAEVSVSDDDINTIIWENGTTPISKADIKTEMDRLQVEYDALDYARKREAEYPTIADQLDKIYHDGIDSWKEEMILPVKNKFPKT
jgi:hypothetical protein